MMDTSASMVTDPDPFMSPKRLESMIGDWALGLGTGLDLSMWGPRAPSDEGALESKMRHLIYDY